MSSQAGPWRALLAALVVAVVVGALAILVRGRDTRPVPAPAESWLQDPRPVTPVDPPRVPSPPPVEPRPPAPPPATPETPPAAARPGSVRIAAASAAGDPIYDLRVQIDGGPTERPSGATQLVLELEPGRHRLDARWGALARQEPFEVAPGQETTVSLVFDAPHSVSGFVRALATGEAIAGALVDINGQRGVSAADGSFRIPYLHAESVPRIVFAACTHPDYWPLARKPVEVGGGSETVGVVLELTRGAATIAVSVRQRGSGEPQPDVPVLVTDAAAAERRAFTDARGVATFQGAPPGRYSAAAGTSRDESILTETMTTFVVGDGSGTVEVSIELPGLLPVALRVPAGVRVIVERQGAQVAELAAHDEEGAREVLLPEGTLDVVLEANGVRVAGRTIAVKEPTSYDLTYLEATPIRGRLSAPLAGLGIGLEPLGFDPDSQDIVPLARLVRSDAEGAFVFDRLPPGRYRLVAPAGWSLSTTPVIEIAVDQPTEELELIVEPSDGTTPR